MREPEDQSATCLTLESLPSAIRAELPPDLQDLYVAAFNGAWRRHADFADREAFCHRVARSAVRSRQRAFVAPLSGKGASTPLPRETAR